jgi:hypothetical protein
MVLANGSGQARWSLFQQFDNVDFQPDLFILVCKGKINDVELDKFWNNYLNVYIHPPFSLKSFNFRIKVSFNIFLKLKKYIFEIKERYSQHKILILKKISIWI